ncbi:MarR family winged helix-turn-helix transcriptional regulator [Arthrobacter sulfonylureivorans]|uniref:MarR family winged helix-turn-helix transcriptional regulator n=1 Tax=Arthrobacter TaxID=1663 RepID=UPI0010AD05CA|nr:MarR family transcriptional regulator [Arthrobacter sp. CAU 1506]TJY69284.1 MarR family transcriptional regulator [Arthrobacter sp. CAU 1506]
MQDEQLELSRQLRPLLTRIYQMVRRRSPGWDVTAAQSSVLTTLMDKGKLRMGELAALEGVKMPTATSVVAGLVRIGLVERQADPNDRRRVLVDLTSDGRSQIAALAAERDREFARLLADLGPEDRTLLEAAAPAMSRLLAVEAANALPAEELGE